MTDDKVKALLERMANECSVDMVLWDQFSNAVLALLAERDNLSAEVERLHHDHQEKAKLAGRQRGRAEAAEAKLTALVEALTKSNDALLALKKLVVATPSLQGRDHIDIGIQVNKAIDAGAQAIAHHSVPVGEPDNAQAERRALITDADREWASAACADLANNPEFIATTPTSAPVTGKSSHRGIPTGDVCTDEFCCPPKLASAPVEDVGGLAWLTLEDAPRDGTSVLLLVDYSAEEACHALEDTSGMAWTIGFNDEDHVEVELGGGWHFAGWCWSHDHFTEGKGRVVAWAPILKPEVVA